MAKTTKREEKRKSRNVKDILKILNKDMKEADKVKIASDQDEGYFKRDVTSTGSPYLDYRIHNEIGKGGFVKGSYNMIIGDEGSAKSSIALLGARAEQKETGKYVAYFDGESALSNSYLDRFEIDRSLFIYRKGRNLEDMLDEAELLSTADDIGMIVFDSIPIFVSSVVEEKTASDNNMAVEARKYTARMPIIEGNCARRDITLLGLTFYTLDPGAMGDPRVTKRGRWQHLMSNLTLEFTKKDLIFDDEKRPIGHIIDVRLKKSKLSAYDAKKPFQLKFYYQYGFNKYDEYAGIFMETGTVNVSGSWIDFKAPDGEVIKIQGRDNLADFFRDNEEIFNHILKQLNDGK